MRVAITGPMYSGKTSLGRFLEKHYDWYFMDYTGSIKQHLVNALNGVYKTNHVSVDDINQDKKRFRPLLQELGSYLGYDEGYYVDEMLERWERDTANDDAERPVYFDNVRFPAQFDLLRTRGFVLVQLQISNIEQRQRARGLGVGVDELERVAAHKAEDGVEAEIWLNGEASVEHNAAVLARASGMCVR